MSGIVLEGALAQLREREIRLLHTIGETLQNVNAEAKADRNRLREVAEDLRDMFLLVVVVGEFNAGKSTFVNALLGDALLPMGITPTTEMIELIRYRDRPNRKPTVDSNNVREWGHPNTGGPGVVLVDTPGTGSVFQKHEQTAKSFLHRSDLVIFVLSAKHAFAETERLYMELIRDYGKKVVVVVNQIDLLEPREQTEVRRFVQTQINQHLDLKPLIFLVSARQTLEGNPAGGIDAVRAHLNATFEQISPAQQKLLTQLDLGSRLLNKYRAVLDERMSLIGHDRQQTSQIEQEMQVHADGLAAQLASTSGDIRQIMDGMRTRADDFISKNFTLRHPRRALDQEALQTEFADVVVGRSVEQVADLANDYVNGLVDSTRRYWQGIVSRLNKLDALLDSIPGVDGGVYAEQREALQTAIVAADAEMASYSSASMLRHMQDQFQSNFSGFSASAGITAIAGAVAFLSVLTPGAITLHPLTLVGTVVGAPVALIGGGMAFRYWRRLRADIKQEFDGRVEALERSYIGAMQELTDRERNRLLQYGRSILEPVFSRFQTLAEDCERDLTALDRLNEEIQTLRVAIESVRPDTVLEDLEEDEPVAAAAAPEISAEPAAVEAEEHIDAVEAEAVQVGDDQVGDDQVSDDIQDDAERLARLGDLASDGGDDGDGVESGAAGEVAGITSESESAAGEAANTAEAVNEAADDVEAVTEEATEVASSEDEAAEPISGQA